MPERSEREFPSTQWSVFLVRDRRNAEAARKRALQTLAESYWKPVFHYIRFRWSATEEDARDLTQEFFLWVMNGTFLERVDIRRGRFRAFVKAALQNYLIDLDRRIKSQKRGGGRLHFRLDAGTSEGEPQTIPDPSGRTPEQVLDESWRDTLLAQATHRLESECAEKDDPTLFRIFQDYYLDAKDDVDYSAVAKRYAVREKDVENSLKKAKRRFREILRGLVSETVASQDDLDGEMRQLFGS